jgi:anti-sigma B factor antagonist
MQNPSTWESETGPWIASADVASSPVSAPLAIRWVTGVHALTVELEGELDLETARELDRQLAAIDATRLERLVIDMRGVTFMDSTGLASIVRAYQTAEKSGYAVVLRRGSNQVQRLFALTGVDERLSFDDEQPSQTGV